MRDRTDFVMDRRTFTISALYRVQTTLKGSRPSYGFKGFIYTDILGIDFGDPL